MLALKLNCEVYHKGFCCINFLSQIIFTSEILETGSSSKNLKSSSEIIANYSSLLLRFCSIYAPTVDYGQAYYENTCSKVNVLSLLQVTLLVLDPQAFNGINFDLLAD